MPPQPHPGIFDRAVVAVLVLVDCCLNSANQFRSFLRGNLKYRDKLIASIPADEVGRTHQPSQELARLPEKIIAGLVTEAVIDGFESIQIHHHYGERILVPDGPVAFLLEPISERSSVGKPRQKI